MRPESHQPVRLYGTAEIHIGQYKRYNVYKYQISTNY